MSTPFTPSTWARRGQRVPMVSSLASDQKAWAFGLPITVRGPMYGTATTLQLADIRELVEKTGGGDDRSRKHEVTDPLVVVGRLDPRSAVEQLDVATDLELLLTLGLEPLITLARAVGDAAGRARRLEHVVAEPVEAAGGLATRRPDSRAQAQPVHPPADVLLPPVRARYVERRAELGEVLAALIRAEGTGGVAA